MSKIIKTVTIIILFASIGLLNVKANDIIGINYLIENAKQFSEKKVTIQGEVIGESMKRGQYCWININDGTNAIGIWIKDSKVHKVENYGNYKRKGDIIKITGMFYRACGEHGGESDIHGDTLEIIKKGYINSEMISPNKIKISVILIAFCMLILYLRIKKRA